MLERLKHIPFVPPAKVNSLFQGAGRNGAWFVATIVRTGKMGLHDPGRAVTHLGIHPSVEGRKRRRAGNEATLSAGQGAVALFTHNAEGDGSNAAQTLHELLAYVLFASGHQLNLIRARVLELAVLMSRAALQGGADSDDVLVQRGAVRILSCFPINLSN
ncbi:MAG: hypothetical protein QM757_03650, partial [Paludibaculum sp.]